MSLPFWIESIKTSKRTSKVFVPSQNIYYRDLQNIFSLSNQYKKWPYKDKSKGSFNAKNSLSSLFPWGILRKKYYFLLQYLPINHKESLKYNSKIREEMCTIPKWLQNGLEKGKLHEQKYLIACQKLYSDPLSSNFA